MAEFKKLSDVEVVAEPIESANVLIEEDGVIKKAPKTAVGGAGGGVVLNCKYNGETISEQPVYDYEQLKTAILSGERVVIIAVETSYNQIHLFVPITISDGSEKYIKFHHDGMNMHLLESRATLTY